MRLKRSAPRVLMTAALVCLGGILGGCGSLEKTLVFPGAASQGRPDAIIPPGGDYELIPLQTADGTGIVAQFGGSLGPGGEPAADSGHAPTVIFDIPLRPVGNNAACQPKSLSLVRGLA